MRMHTSIMEQGSIQSSRELQGLVHHIMSRKDREEGIVHLTIEPRPIRRGSRRHIPSDLDVHTPSASH